MDEKYLPGIKMIKQWEQCRLEAYDDGGGVWTIGWGRTKDVQEGDTCTQREADLWFYEDDLRDAIEAVDRWVEVFLNPNQYGAILSFTYNLGEDNLRKSTLLRKLNGRDWDGVVRELPRWCKQRIDGELVVVQGLVNRRTAEVALWSKWSCC